jgi:hypothetical protein
MDAEIPQGEQGDFFSHAPRVVVKFELAKPPLIF